MKPTTIDLAYRIVTATDRNGATYYVVDRRYRGALAKQDKQKKADKR